MDDHQDNILAAHARDLTIREIRKAFATKDLVIGFGLLERFHRCHK